MSLKNKVFVFIACVFLLSCNNNCELGGVISDNKYEYGEYIYISDYMEGKPAFISHCQKKAFQDVEISIRHECINEKELSNYAICVGIGSQICYYQKYTPKIKIKNMGFCLDEEDFGGTFTVDLIDKKNKKIHVWGIKENYDMEKMYKVDIILFSELDWNDNRMSVKCYYK